MMLFSAHNSGRQKLLGMVYEIQGYTSDIVLVAYAFMIKTKILNVTILPLLTVFTSYKSKMQYSGFPQQIQHMLVGLTFPFLTGQI